MHGATQRSSHACLEDMISQQDNLVEDNHEKHKRDPQNDIIDISKPAVEAQKN